MFMREALKTLNLPRQTEVYFPHHGIAPTPTPTALRGRQLTKEGQRDCDRIAQQILFPEIAAQKAALATATE